MILLAISGNSFNWPLNSDQTYEALWIGVVRGLLISRKTQLISFDLSKNSGAIDVKKSSFKKLLLSFFSKSLLSFFSGFTTLSQLLKLERWFVLWSFSLLGFDFVCNPLCLACFAVVLPGLMLLESVGSHRNWYVRTVNPTLADSLEPLAHISNVASVYHFYSYFPKWYFWRYSSGLAEFFMLFGPPKMEGSIKLPLSFCLSV